jgi:hypothetical protein
MGNKERFILKIFLSLILFVFLINFISAANETSVDAKGYSWLKSELAKNNCSKSSSTEQIAFSLIAMGYDSSTKSLCKSALMSREKDNCFTSSNSGNCDVKSTALAIIALEHIGVNTEDYVNWSLSKRTSLTGLNWFLEIDSENLTSCKIKVDGKSEKTFTIAEDKTISGSSTCLSPSENNYFLKIDSSCLNKNFTISCDNSFISTFLYKKPTGNVYYVSSETHSASSGGETYERVDSYCFKDGNSCSYEANLWASIAMSKSKEEIKYYIPYLSAMADESVNSKYFPSTFLYYLTNEQEYFSQVTDNQKDSGYWKESTNEYYDTSLAALFLGSSGSTYVSDAKEYITSKQKSTGSWGSENIRDTALVLLSFWPKTSVSDTEPSQSANCESSGLYCRPSSDCGVLNLAENYRCSLVSEECCKVAPPVKQTCAAQSGIICGFDEYCPSGNTLDTSDSGECCAISCVLSQTVEDTCTPNSGTCKSSCDTKTEDDALSYTCVYSEDVCCLTKSSSKGINWVWIIILIFLIALVILGIVFRDRLRLMLFKSRNKVDVSRGPGITRRPPMMPPSSGMFNRSRQIIPRPTNQPTQARRPLIESKSEKEKDFDDTMKKLKEMSK